MPPNREEDCLSVLLRHRPHLYVVADDGVPSPVRTVGRRFAQIPLEWLGDPVWQRQIAPALRLYLVLQFATKRGARPVRLTNSMAAGAGIERRHKTRYLRQLEAQDLVEVVRDGNRNPEVSLTGVSKL